MQTLYKFVLEPIAECTADPNSYGFRAKRCTHDAIEQCFTSLNKRKSPKWILENIPMDKTLLNKWLKCGFIETNQLLELGSDIYGNISRIDNAIDAIPKKLDIEKAMLLETNQQFINAKEEVEKPFEKEDELQNLSKRLSKLNKELDIGGKGDKESLTFDDESPEENDRPSVSLER